MEHKAFDPSIIMNMPPKTYTSCSEDLEGFFVDSNASREELNFLAQVADSSGRNSDVIKIMTALAERPGVSLNADERNRLYVAYTNKVDGLRGSCRNLQHFLDQKTANTVDYKQGLSYKYQVEKRLCCLCREFLVLLDKYFVTAATDMPTIAVTYKMTADYNRYLAVYSDGEERDACINLALQSYKYSYKCAKESLPAYSVILLGVALNFSVFYHEVMHMKSMAISIASMTFSEAMKAMDKSESTHFCNTGAANILNLLQHNLKLWKKTPMQQEPSLIDDSDDDGGRLKSQESLVQMSTEQEDQELTVESGDEKEDEDDPFPKEILIELKNLEQKRKQLACLNKEKGERNSPGNNYVQGQKFGVHSQPGARRKIRQQQPNVATA